MKSFWNLFLLFLVCVCFQHPPWRGGWLYLTAKRQWKLPVSIFRLLITVYLLEISCYFSYGEQRKTESSAASHHPSSDAKECQEMPGGVLVGWDWNGCSPASLQISLPDLDSDGQTLSLGSKEIPKSSNEFPGNLQLLSRLCIYAFILLLYVCESSKRDDGLSECFYPNCNVQRAVIWAAGRGAFLKIHWSQWAYLYDSERR